MLTTTQTHKQRNAIRYFSSYDLEDRGVQFHPGAVQQSVEDALRDMGQGIAYGRKSSLCIAESEMSGFRDFSRYQEEFADERLGWKLSSLHSVNDRYAAVKVIGANAFNRRLGLPRSTSTIMLLDKYTMQPLCILDGTRISSVRTGAYASITAGLFLRERRDVSVFLFGTSTIAESILVSLNHSNAKNIAQIFIKGRMMEHTERFVAEMRSRVQLPLIASADTKPLKTCDFVISATNAKHPLYGGAEMPKGAVSLHLGGDETPADYLRHVIRRGQVFCDDVNTVASRGSQSLALLFSREGSDLATVASALGIRNLCDIRDDDIPSAGEPVFVNCVGLPVLDLYVTKYIYETFLQ